MLLSAAKANLITSALRFVAMAYIETAKQNDAKGDKTEAAKAASYARACADLAEEFETRGGH